MNEEHIVLWKECLRIIKDNISNAQFESWFAPIEVGSYDKKENTLVLNVPTPYYVEHLEGQYGKLLIAALMRVYGSNIRLRFSYNVVKDDPQTHVVAEEPRKSRAVEQRNLAVDPFTPQEYGELDPQLNPIYTFENYCESQSNKLPYAIAKAIATDPKCQTFNPMFVFGPTGVGKTHLIQAIGIKMKECHPSSRVLYLSARTFVTQYTAAVKNNTLNDFLNFYQSIDMLIIDDVQELSGKTATQNTFFHIFNHLHNKQKHLILSSDCPPSELDGMEPRLLSRFKWGMTVELSSPDYDLRKNVLLRKSMQAGVEMPEEVVDFIAQNVKDNVRELEGVFVSLMAYATTLNQPFTIDLARNVLSNSVKISKRQITFEGIVEKVCSQYSISSEMLYSKSRKRDVADSRQLIMALAKKHTKMSSTTIGMKLKRNHATVLHACKTIDERMSVDKDFKNMVESIEQSLM